MIAVSISTLRAKIKYYFDLVSQSSEMILVSRKSEGSDAVIILSLEEYNQLQARAKGTEQSIPGQASTMNESTFWRLIDQLAWDKGIDNAAIIHPVVEQLMTYTKQDIFTFQEILSAKLYALDQKVYAENLGTYRYNGPKNFSGDAFLYARAAVVANGQKFYQRVLSDPTQMPKEYTFESILYIAPQAYRKKTGKDWTHFTQKSYETFSNAKGWDGYGLLDRLLNL